LILRSAGGRSREVRRVVVVLAALVAALVDVVLVSMVMSVF
jgi:hypothetical protein